MSQLVDDADKVIAEVQSDLQLFSTWMSGPRGAKLRQRAEQLGALLEGKSSAEILNPAKPLPDAANAEAKPPSNVAPVGNGPGPDAPPAS